jgi:GNAT superfamily N-acetyltransferase
MPLDYTIAPAGIDQVETVVEQRRAMFLDMGHRDTAVLDRMTADFRPWVAARMQSGDYLAWFARTPDGAIVGGVGLWLMDWLPHLTGSPPRGNIVNVYTRPDFRRQGIARALVAAAVECCRSRGIRYLILHASPEGRPLYESLGFASTNEMRILL